MTRSNPREVTQPGIPAITQPSLPAVPAITQPGLSKTPDRLGDLERRMARAEANVKRLRSQVLELKRGRQTRPGMR